MTRLTFAVVLGSTLVGGSARATFTVVAADTVTKQIGASGASCIGAGDLMGFIYAGVPGKGAVILQSWPDPNRHRAARDQVALGTAPMTIMAGVTAGDVDVEKRQWAIVDTMGRFWGRNGSDQPAFAMHSSGTSGDFVWMAQVNGATGMPLLDQLAAGFQGSACDLAEHLMKALEAAPAGSQGVSKCVAGGTPANNAFITVSTAASADWLKLSSGSDAAGFKAIVELRTKYDAWRAANPCPGSVVRDGGVDAQVLAPGMDAAQPGDASGATTVDATLAKADATATTVDATLAKADATAGTADATTATPAPDAPTGTADARPAADTRPADARAVADGGTSGGTESSDGCGCRMDGTGGDSGALPVVALALATEWFRRRRSRARRASERL